MNHRGLGTNEIEINHLVVQVARTCDTVFGMQMAMVYLTLTRRMSRDRSMVNIIYESIEEIWP